MFAAALLLCAPVVVDGDTLRDCTGQRWRLARIQAADDPASSPCRQRRPGYDCDASRYRESRDNLRRLIAGREVACSVVDADPRVRGFQPTDRYGRPVARCVAGGRDLSAEQLRGNFAVAWPLRGRSGERR